MVECGKKTPLFHQLAVQWLVNRPSPVQRLLVAHELGSGKTLAITMVLDNYFHDIRPKVVLFPTQATVKNFYNELLIIGTPNPYRDYVNRVYKGVVPTEGTDQKTVNKYMEEAKRILEFKGTLAADRGPNDPAAPLRAFESNAVGGSNWGEGSLGGPMVNWVRRRIYGGLNRGDKKPCTLAGQHGYNLRRSAQPYRATQN